VRPSPQQRFSNRGGSRAEARSYSAEEHRRDPSEAMRLL